MRSGFKMRQSASEGGGLVAHSRTGLGHDGGGLLDEGLDDSCLVGGGGRLGIGSSSTVNSLSSSPGGRTGDTRLLKDVRQTMTKVCMTRV